MSQTDLFQTSRPRAERPSDEVVSVIRARLEATLAQVRSATTMPWTDTLAIIREDNAFRFAKDALPREEGEALWASFNAEMDRLYEILDSDGHLASRLGAGQSGWLTA